MGQTIKDFSYSQSNSKTPFNVIIEKPGYNYQIITSNTYNKGIKFIVARYLDVNGGITSSTYPFSWSLTGTNLYSARS